MQARKCLVSLSLLSAVLLGSAVEASEEYDNPTLGSTPCVVLKDYQAMSNGAERFGATASVENVCGRSVEVAFCFPFIAPDEETEPHCFNGVIRPWATSSVAVGDLPARLAGPDFHWRWRGHPMDSDR